MASLLVLLIISGCAAYQYFKGNVIKAFVTIVIVICAGTAAFGYFELLANVFISRGGDSSHAFIVPWVQMLSFVLLFVVVFAILQTASARLMRYPIDLGFLTERIGRCICGILLGLFLSGVLLVALAMAPLSSKYPYQRFDWAKPNPESASGVLFNVDDFVAGLFGMLSGGVFSGDTSFAAVHPDFISQLYLVRHSEIKNIDVVTTAQAIDVPPKKAVWPAPDVLNNADDSNTTISAQGGNTLMIVRVGLNKNAIKEYASFTLSQVRIICKPREDAKDALKGRGRNIYPIGYLAAAGQINKKGLRDTITFKREEFGEKPKLVVDFVCEVPKDYIPVLIEYKQNNIASLPSPVTAEQAMSEETSAVPAKETTVNSEK